MMQRRNKPNLRADYLWVHRLADRDVLHMHQIWTRYFQNSPFDKFERDIRCNDGVVVVRDLDVDRIVGFTTMKKLSLTYQGRKAYGVLSSDSVVDHQYWGNNEFLVGYLSFLTSLKLRHPKRDVFWMVTAKNYKTYLFMAQNVRTYYPRFDKPVQPDMQELVDSFCNERYKPFFNPKSGVLYFGPNSQKFRAELAPINAELRQRFPEIAFFEKQNPEWYDGRALACAGLIDWPTLFTYARNILRRTLQDRFPFLDRRKSLAHSTPRLKTVAADQRITL